MDYGAPLRLPRCQLLEVDELYRAAGIGTVPLHWPVVVVGGGGVESDGVIKVGAWERHRIY